MKQERLQQVMVLFEVCTADNTKTGIAAMTEENWEKRTAETVGHVLRDYYDAQYAGCDDECFCYEDEIKKAAEALTAGGDTEFNGDSVLWEGVPMASNVKSPMKRILITADMEIGVGQGYDSMTLFDRPVAADICEEDFRRELARLMDVEWEPDGNFRYIAITDREQNETRGCHLLATLED